MHSTSPFTLSCNIHLLTLPKHRTFLPPYDYFREITQDLTTFYLQQKSRGQQNNPFKNVALCRFNSVLFWLYLLKLIPFLQSSVLLHGVTFLEMPGNAWKYLEMTDYPPPTLLPFQKPTFHGPSCLKNGSLSPTCTYKSYRSLSK